MIGTPVESRVFLFLSSAEYSRVGDTRNRQQRPSAESGLSGKPSVLSVPNAMVENI